MYNGVRVSENNTENICSGQDLDAMAVRRVHHRQDDPVTPNAKMGVHYPSRTVAPSRKIASAPPAPTYKGQWFIGFRSAFTNKVAVQKVSGRYA